jgi:hypothetical protein
VDSHLLANAESNYAETIDSLDNRAQQYANQFHVSVIVPFCNQHNLRFWSGNGTWFFETPGGKNLDPEDVGVRWGIATGNARLTEPVCQDELPRWVLACGEADLPDFIFSLQEIERLLSLPFMSGCLGYWITDFKPSTFPENKHGV